MKLGKSFLSIVLAIVMIFTSFVSLGIITVSAEGGNVYYVSTSGNDENAGSESAPWKTILFASRKLQAGDTLIVRGGTYEGDCFWSFAAGTATNPITVKAYDGEVPVITGSGLYDQILHFQRDNSYFIIDGINTDITSKCTPVYVGETSHITFKNCSFKNNAGEASTIMQLNKSSYITIDNCTFDTTGGSLIGGDGEGEGIYVNGSNHCLIQNSYFTKNGHYALDLKDYNDGGKTPSYNNIVRNNLINQYWSGGIGLIFNAHHNVVENNRIYYVGEGCTYPKTGIQLAADKNIIRNNIIGWSSDGGSKTVGSVSSPISILSYRYGSCNQNSTDNRLYNNVTYKNGGKSLMISEKHETVITGNKLLNNIFYYDKTGGTSEPWWPEGNWYMLVETYHSTTYTVWHTQFPRKNYFGNNIWLHADAKGEYPGIKMFYFDGGKEGSQSWGKTLSEMQSTYPTYFFGNIEKNPNFVNGDNGDFRLKSDSPAIDAGAHLAKTVEAGTAATTVIIDDALFFTDGYGIAEGDKVKIGNNAPVTITSIDYDLNKLTVSAPLTFAKGDYVDISYNGSAPDIGAVEYTANSTPMPTLAARIVATSTPAPTMLVTPTPTPTTTVPVATPKMPVVNSVDDNDKAITGKAEPNLTVIAKRGNNAIGSSKVKNDGSFSIQIAVQKAGTVLQVIAKISAGNESKAVLITVKDKTPPSTPVVNLIKSTSKTLTGKAEAGATVYVKKGTTVVGSGVTKTNGTFTITIKAQKSGTVLYVTAKDKAGNISAARKVIVKK